MYAVCVINHECMHKKVRYLDKARNTPEKCNPKEAGLFSEMKVFGAEFTDFKCVLEVSLDLAEHMYDKKNWQPGFVKNFIYNDKN